MNTDFFDLRLVWFVLVGLLFTGYAVLDGFDLGVGALHLFTKKDEERRLLLNSIGPVWDGNEVWLVTGGGALFAAFPGVYATVFSGFYLYFILLLFGLIFRAVAIEFRGKQPFGWWRSLWDVSFSFSSILSSFLIGIILGNLAWGIPLTPEGEFGGTALGLIHPYPFLMGLATVTVFMMHGSIYAVMKTEGELQEFLRRRVNQAIIFFILCYGTLTFATLLYVPHMTVLIRKHPLLFAVPFLNLLAIANVPREMVRRRYSRAFLSSCAALVLLLALFGLGMFPYLVVSHPHPECSLTLYNSASSVKTLRILSVAVLIGMPLVLAYTVSVYWIFRGKVKLESGSY